MADVNIQVQAEVNQAVASLGKVNTALGKTVTAAEKSGGGFKSMVGKLNSAVTATTGFNLSQLGTVAVLAKGVQVLKQSVSEWVSYTNAMTDGARLTGIQVEEYSKLVQVADDVRLSQEQLKTAFQIASRQGVDVSIEGIKSLADRYNSLTDPVEKAQLLLKTFGRSGADMGRLLEKGGEGIDAATAAVANNLIVTEKSAAEAERARLAFDNLEDTWQGMKNTLAQAVIPSLTKLLDLFGEGIEVAQKLKDWNGELADVWEDHRQKLEKLSSSWEDYAFEMIRSGIDAKKFNGVAATQAQLLVDGQLSVEGYSLNLKELAKYLKLSDEATFYANKEMVEFNGTMYDTPAALAKARDEFDRLTSSTKDNMTATERAAAELEAAALAASNLSDALSSQMDLTLKLTDLTGNYTEKMTGLKDEHQALEDKLANLKLKFPWDKEGIAQATADLQANEAEIKKTADAYDEAQKRIVWDMMVAKLSIDGYTQAEFDWAMQAGVDMGIITQESADLAVALMADAEKEIKAFEDTQTALAGIKDWIDRLESKDIYVKTYYESIGNPPPAGAWQDFSDWTPTANANGGPAYANQPGWVGERGPELFLPGRNGQIISNEDILAALRVANQSTTTQTYNLTMHTQNANAESVILGFRAMQLMEQ